AYPHLPRIPTRRSSDLGPIDKEQDVPGFFLDDRLERVDKGFGKEARTLGRLEKAEGEEAVDAFAVARHHEGPFRIALDHIFGLRSEEHTSELQSPDHLV